MRRWNGWGEDGIDAPLPPAAADLLTLVVGPGDAAAGRDPRGGRRRRAGQRARRDDPVLDDDPEVRVRHARGQSLPDWIALRSGRLGAVPDAVAPPGGCRRRRPAPARAAARSAGARSCPYGGGTSVVGGVTAPEPTTGRS